MSVNRMIRCHVRDVGMSRVEGHWAMAVGFAC